MILIIQLPKTEPVLRFQYIDFYNFIVFFLQLAVENLFHIETSSRNLGLRPNICCFFENLAVYYFTFFALHSEDKLFNEQQILGLNWCDDVGLLKPVQWTFHFKKIKIYVWVEEKKICEFAKYLKNFLNNKNFYSFKERTLQHYVNGGWMNFQFFTV